MTDKNKCCCFTGHRMIRTEHINIILPRLEAEIRKLYSMGIRDFISGGARGFDTIAAEAVLSLRDELPEIRLILALPCRVQTKGWNKKDIFRYDSILSDADEVHYISEEYTPECMHKRNRFMVDNSAHCIFYMTHMRGGTAYTVRYALESELEMHNIMV